MLAQGEEPASGHVSGEGDVHRGSNRAGVKRVYLSERAGVR